ncbi:MAG TPA: PKD domain-containing protein [Casimicrobiaceae bacterium]|nr:PKD domain-containing protein [Casimicrobiaceae bacterium]
MKLARENLIDGSKLRWQKAARLLGAALFAMFSALPALAQTYDVMNLGLDGGWSGVRAINAQGQVAGLAYTASGEIHAFFASQADGNIDIGTLGEPYAQPNSINASGQVVGDSCTMSGDWTTCRAFFWTKAGGIVSLGTLGGSWSTAVAINDSGKVIGRSQIANGDDHAYSWTQAGGMVDLGTLGGTGRFSEPFSINALGQVAGYSYTADNTRWHAVVWQPGGAIVDLGSLGGDFSWAWAINDAGQVTGTSQWVDQGSYSYQHPFFWSPVSGMVDVGTLGGIYAFPNAINASGQVIGTSLTAANDFRQGDGFTWSMAGGLVDLTLGGASSSVSAVSASGQVVGAAAIAGSGAPHAFAWTNAGGIRELGTLGGSSSSANSTNVWGQAVGQSMLAGDSTTHAFLYDGGALKDLNNLARNKPAGMELVTAFLLSDGKQLVAWTTSGAVLLSPSSTVAAAPVVGPISANDPVAVGAVLSAGASFTDAAGDTHSASWTWGDGSPSAPGSVSETGGSGTVAGSHTYAEAGVYPVGLSVTDNTGKTSQVSRNVVVYDPSAGFVTGSGWIQSPAGAFKADPTVIGRATFGFVAKYQKGAKVPTGNTEFHFQSADLDFHSDSYDWLVVGGARAQFKGTGTLNRSGDYKFLLTAVDGALIAGGNVPDRFRIKIWYYDADLKQDVVVYDNQVSSSTEGTTSEGTAIGGGSIVVHTSNK